MLKKFLLIVFLIFYVNSLMAQNPTSTPGNESGSETGGLDVDPATGLPPAPEGAVPVDAGLGFLLAGGIAYGAKKAYDYKKNKVKSEK